MLPAGKRLLAFFLTCAQDIAMSLKGLCLQGMLAVAKDRCSGTAGLLAKAWPPAQAGWQRLGTAHGSCILY
eukprot:567895-Pelagomonas_calceolata.AAC.1